MVTIRLKRIGAKFAPFYRIVVIHNRNPRDGRPLEEIGTYNPRTSPSTSSVKADRALHWLNQGAQPSATVKNLFRKIGLMKHFKEGTAPAAPTEATEAAAAK